jgi:L-lactate dehydrogenase complex protein LldF
MIPKRGPLDPSTSPPFPIAAAEALKDSQLRRNLAHATSVIQNKRSGVVAEMSDWEDLRESGRQIRQHSMKFLDAYLQQFEENCVTAGGTVHWARDAREANEIVLRLVQQAYERQPVDEPREVIKIKSMATEEIHLNDSLESAGIRAFETDLAELIIQLGHDQPSHLVVPALHKNRHQIREIFQQEMGLPELGDSPQDLADAARTFLREKFLKVPVAVSGANFLVAETGSVVIVESEGNGRMCLTLPDTLITIAGIDKILPRYQDLEVMLQVLPRSATGERMNPYNSIWTGVTDGDGPQNFHVVLMDNGRTNVLADEVGRDALHCIRCGACQNVCPVYKETGGHAYGSVYAGPIGAILTPQLQRLEHAESLPFASSLCGACYEVCPVKINIPELLVHLRGKIAERKPWFDPEKLAMQAVGKVFLSEQRLHVAQTVARLGEQVLSRDDGTGVQWITWLPGLGGGWTQSRDLRAIPEESFRDWWKARENTSK